MNPNSEDTVDQLLFDPPLYKQRYLEVARILEEENVSRVCNFSLFSRVFRCGVYSFSIRQLELGLVFSLEQ